MNTNEKTGFEQQQYGGGAYPGATYPQANYSQPGGVTVVMANVGGCPSCHNGQLVSETNCCALVLLIIVAIAWFPIGLFYLFMMHNTRQQRCTSCGHISGKNATPIYILFGILITLEVIAVVVIVVVIVEVVDVTKAIVNCNGFGCYKLSDGSCYCNNQG